MAKCCLGDRAGRSHETVDRLLGCQPGEVDQREQGLGTDHRDEVVLELDQPGGIVSPPAAQGRKSLETPQQLLQAIWQ